MDSVEHVITAIDELHREDPAGKELGYAERLTHWLHELNENPDPLLAIAVRAQHLKRWEHPRTAFPEGRIGYLQWRREAARHHADLVSGIMRKAGFDEAAIAHVASVVTKRDLSRDKDAQTLEDCAALTFLETELAAFSAKHPQSKVDDILQKTWKKMSPEAQRLAGALLPDPPG